MFVVCMKNQSAPTRLRKWWWYGFVLWIRNMDARFFIQKWGVHFRSRNKVICLRLFFGMPTFAVIDKSSALLLCTVCIYRQDGRRNSKNFTIPWLQVLIEKCLPHIFFKKLTVHFSSKMKSYDHKTFSSFILLRSVHQPDIVYCKIC